MPEKENSSPRVDLRSDTLTQPCPAMRQAMAEAKVGDDTYNEDPTVNHLQEVAAELLGKESAIYVPSGTMANQIAIKIQTQPGDNMLVGQQGHTWMFEGGATGLLSSVQVSVLPGDGRFEAEAVRSVAKPSNDIHFSPTRLVSLENTHNMSGGTVWDQNKVKEVLKTAKDLGLATHLDGARLWNAAVKTGLSEKELAEGFDTVSVCLSKGLGAPIGSLLCGSQELIHQARRMRKVFGGAMRQAGIIAAGGLYAIQNNRAKLNQDHENATLLATGLNKLSGMTVDLDQVHTNIVMVDLGPNLDGRKIEAQAAAQGVFFSSFSKSRIRLVTHLDVSQDDCKRAIEVIANLLV